VKEKKRDGILAPTIIVALIVLVDIVTVAAVVFMLTTASPGFPVGILLVVAASILVSSVLAIYVLRARIKEIRSGWKDDLGKY